jgi:hypothetical protein
MRGTTKLVLAVVLGFAVVAVALAGSLTPPGPPAPTGTTVQQIGERIGQVVVGVQSTGQTECFNPSTGSTTPCAGTGQDAEFGNGTSVSSPRFTNNFDGTVTDNLTDLTWLRNSNCFGLEDWPSALSRANNLASGACGLTDGSVAGDWRLPNVHELATLLEFGRVAPVHTPLLAAGHPFLIDIGPPAYADWFWTSTSVNPNQSTQAVSVSFKWGRLFPRGKNDLLKVWPVRDGR